LRFNYRRKREWENLNLIYFLGSRHVALNLLHIIGSVFSSYHKPRWDLGRSINGVCA
jgi:hypothetical protein